MTERWHRLCSQRWPGSHTKICGGGFRPRFVFLKCCEYTFSRCLLSCLLGPRAPDHRVHSRWLIENFLLGKIWNYEWLPTQTAVSFFSAFVVFSVQYNVIRRGYEATRVAGVPSSLRALRLRASLEAFVRRAGWVSAMISRCGKFRNTNSTLLERLYTDMIPLGDEREEAHWPFHQTSLATLITDFVLVIFNRNDDVSTQEQISKQIYIHCWILGMSNRYRNDEREVMWMYFLCQMLPWRFRIEMCIYIEVMEVIKQRSDGSPCSLLWSVSQSPEIKLENATYV